MYLKYDGPSSNFAFNFKLCPSIMAAVAHDNQERFIVCTQDEKLRKKLRKTSPFVPVIFCHTSGGAVQVDPGLTAVDPTLAFRHFQGLSALETKT